MFTKRIINYLMIACIVSSLLFSYAYINSLISHKYEIEDSRGSLTAYQQDILAQAGFNKAAMQLLCSALIILIGLRIGMERWTRKTGYRVKQAK